MDPLAKLPPERQPPASAAAPSAQPTPQSQETQGYSDPAAAISSLQTADTVPDPPAASVVATTAGKQIAGYELLEAIGRGGMGIVFKARQPDTGQIVAVKMIRDAAFAGPEIIERFNREVQALGRVQPVKNLVPIYHVGHDEHQVFYVMPYLAGGNLAQRRAQLRNEPRMAVAMVEKIARAAHELHAQHIVHRDVKPSNILLDGAGEPYLSDLGLAKMLDQDETLTRTQQRLGTPSYMAPEQTGLTPAPVGPATDIWALGVILYELLTGARPFAAGADEEGSTLLWKIANADPPAPRSLNADLDANLEAVILKCLEKDPRNRFGSARDLADELGRWLRAEKLQTRPIGSARRMLRRRGAVATTVVFAVAVGAAALIIWQRQAPERALAAVQREFADKGEVVLVPDKGEPRWSAPAIDNRYTTYLDREGHWTIESWDLAVIDLYRDVPFPAYKLRAEIRHQSSDPTPGMYYGHVGLFLGHQAASSARDTPHFFCNLYFNDVVSEAPKQPLPVPPPPGNTARLKYRLFADTGGSSPVDEFLGWSKAARYEYTGIQANRWRTLEMELQPEAIVCRFDGQAMEPLQRDYANQEFRKILLDRLAQYPAKYGPLGDVNRFGLSDGGSLGLVVSKGSIAVKNVVLTRTMQPNDE